MRYRIIYGRTRRNYAGYTPDLPICIAAADTLDECRVLMRQGIRYHLEALAEDGDVRPRPTGYLEILDFPPERASARSQAARATPAGTRAGRAAPRTPGRAAKPTKKALTRTG